MAESVSIEVSQTQVDLDSFSSSLELIPSLEGIEEKPERPGEPCSLSIPKLEPLDLGEEFKFENFPFLKYPEEFISEKRRGIQESTTETELKCDVVPILVLLEPRAIESEHSIIQNGTDNVDFSQSMDNSGDLFISPFISILETISWDILGVVCM